MTGESAGKRSRTLANAVCGSSTNGWMPRGTGNVSNSSTKLSASASVLFIFQLVPTHSWRVFGDVMTAQLAPTQLL
jgi:hypothetical protein